VLLVGLGAVPVRLLAEVGRALREQLQIAVQAGGSLDRPLYALNEPREQYHAPAILRRLAGLRPTAGGAPVLGVVAVDLFVPDADAEFVLADADRDAGAAVISTKRLHSPDPVVLARRVRAEAVHAAGQLLGLSPCHDPRCAMFASGDAVDSDRKGPGLCGACRAALAL
jgi:archaemetzincin